MAFDVKCLELAVYFLGDGATDRLKFSLAQHVQDAVETWLQIEMDHRAAAVQPKIN